MAPTKGMRWNWSPEARARVEARRAKKGVESGQAAKNRGTEIKADRQEVGRLFKSGLTLEEVGEQVGVTRERVRQIINAHFPELAEARRQQRREEQAERVALREEARLLSGKVERRVQAQKLNAAVAKALQAGESLKPLADTSGVSVHGLHARASYLRKKGEVDVYLRFNRMRKSGKDPLWAVQTMKLINSERGKRLTREQQAKALGVSLNGLMLRLKKLGKLGKIDYTPKKRTTGWAEPTLKVLREKKNLFRAEQAALLNIAPNTLTIRVQRLIKDGVVKASEVRPRGRKGQRRGRAR